jgi:hypothetical protein
VTDGTTRVRSAALFGNETFVEVVLALADERGAATAQQLSRATGIDHSMVRSVLLRAVAAGIVQTLPRAGGSRSAQYYQPANTSLWNASLELARVVATTSKAAGAIRRPPSKSAAPKKKRVSPAEGE